MGIQTRSGRRIRVQSENLRNLTAKIASAMRIGGMIALSRSATRKISMVTAEFQKRVSLTTAMIFFMPENTMVCPGT